MALAGITLTTTDPKVAAAVASLVTSFSRVIPNSTKLTFLDGSEQPNERPETYHVLYQKGDDGVPDSIKDSNGDVALGLCKLCNRAEIELREPCDLRNLKVLEMQVSQLKREKTELEKQLADAAEAKADHLQLRQLIAAIRFNCPDGIAELIDERKSILGIKRIEDQVGNAAGHWKSCHDHQRGLYKELKERNKELSKEISELRQKILQEKAVIIDGTTEWHNTILQHVAQGIAASMKDDPETDCTDAAHPAWWRGNDAGVRSCVSKLTELLDEPNPQWGSYGSEGLTKLHNRILSMRAALHQICDTWEGRSNFGSGMYPRLAQNIKHGRDVLRGKSFERVSSMMKARELMDWLDEHYPDPKEKDVAARALERLKALKTANELPW